MLLGSLLFVLGFTVIFVILGATTGGLASWLFTWQDEITVVMGALLILLGLVFAGFVPLLQREWRIHKHPRRRARRGAVHRRDLRARAGRPASARRTA